MPQTLNEFLDEIETLLGRPFGENLPYYSTIILLPKAAKIIREMNTAISNLTQPPHRRFSNGVVYSDLKKNIDKILNGETE